MSPALQALRRAVGRWVVGNGLLHTGDDDCPVCYGSCLEPTKVPSGDHRHL